MMERRSNIQITGGESVSVHEWPLSVNDTVYAKVFEEVGFDVFEYHDRSVSPSSSVHRCLAAALASEFRRFLTLW